ncbi:fluoride efflux transporter CrcB [Acinetobacter radioresistens]|jgi:CrcB protein|uniref:fluoride efflux transporter CrcB n=1 Tax=Acinetobacter TaxID=469 RepID=UPI00047B8BE9|nr:MULTISPECIES: fluoride efflux transporter CrcB [Acinetobacter]KRI45722.1 camphor resistance protein CrcB [Acinetobacter baumannii]MCU4518529.1 fluoride efflux transporter CrcB [Acinetobacter radioresistens]PKD86064.1 fluoride efflux transporter CrcB [Acinetobacter radioresistens]RSO63151.1 fluoride efflux transporter CrcB [Acinetobacter radioresistens]TPT72304.1 fluoride efflux transporter CrcB [Acinetobacter baumannii]
MYLSLLSIALGSVIGAWLRWGISLRFNRVFENIPFGTVIVNLTGAFIIGLAVSFFSNSSISPNYKLFVVTGFCGALTTFSTFSVEIVEFLQASKLEYAISTIAIHVIGSLIFTVLGILSYQFFTNH